MRLIGAMLVMAMSFCFAQDSSDFKPATSNVLGAKYPQVDSNSRVQIRLKAPDASKVRINFWSGPKAEMEKQADGFWTFTTPPMAPGLHYYTVIVDGAEVSDSGALPTSAEGNGPAPSRSRKRVRHIICRRMSHTGRSAKSGITRR